MATIFKAEIFRQEASIFRSVHLYVEDNGDVKLSAQDVGQWVDEVWYDSDYEHWVTVQGIGAKRLLFTLLRDKFQSRPNAVTDFKAFCEANDIVHEFDCW